MAADKPRILQNNRDLALSLIPLVIICLIVAGLAGQCSFSPGGPTQGEIPHYEASAVLQRDARHYTFPIRLPETPGGWSTNSGSTDPNDGNDGGTAIRVGYITNLPKFEEHIQHCLRYLLHSVLCSADTTLEEDHPVWDEETGTWKHSSSGLGMVHECRDWTAVRRYMIDHPPLPCGRPDCI